MAHDVFVSYPHADKATADAVVNALENRAVRCWVAPRDVPPGADWAGAIIEAIDGCRLVVLVFSGATNDSDHVMREVRAASDAGVAIVPFRTEEVEPTPSLRYYLGGTHWLDALTEPLAVHLDRLSATVASMVGAAPRDDATPPPAGAPAAQAKWWNRVPIAAWVGAAVAVAAVLVSIGVLVSSRDSDEPPTDAAADTEPDQTADDPSEEDGGDSGPTGGDPEDEIIEPPAGEPEDDPAAPAEEGPSTDAPHIGFTLANRAGPSFVCDMWPGAEGELACDVLGDTSPAADVAMADFDFDGRLDHALAQGNVDENGVLQPSSNTVCLGRGPSAAAPPFECSEISGAMEASQSIVAADFDQNGGLELLIGNATETEPPFSPVLVHCRGDGSGGFGCSPERVEIALDMNLAPWVDDMDVADLDGDGDLDAALAIWNGANQRCLYVGGDQAGQFAAPEIEFTCSAVEPEQAFSSGVVFDDFDERGALDLVFSNYGTPNRLCRGDGTGGFDCTDISGPDNPAFAVDSGDIDQDGHADLLIGRADSNESFDLDDENRDEVCLGDGTGTFGCTILPNEKGEGALDLVLQDIDDDGVLDYISVGLSNVVCLGAGDGSFACTPFQPEVRDERGFEVPTAFNAIALHELRE